MDHNKRNLTKEELAQLYAQKAAARRKNPLAFIGAFFSRLAGSIRGLFARREGRPSYSGQDGYAYDDERHEQRYTSPSYSAGGSFRFRVGEFFRYIGAWCAFIWGRVIAFFSHMTATKWISVAAVALIVILLPTVIGVSLAKNRADGYDETPLLAVAPPQSASPSPSAIVSPTPSPTVAPTPSPTPEPHPSNTVIKHGVTASVVAEIQERLMALGYMEEDEPTEYFGSITQGAIELFQRQHGLDMDGKVGMETYTLLMSEQAQRYTVMFGASGTDVKELQNRLYELGYMDNVTGYFGEETQEAVRKFQQYNGLSSDGKVGSKTREALYSADAKAYFMKYGEKSDEVKEYQALLKKLGYMTTTPDGVYGKDTMAAVRRFQEINGLISDGFLGPGTISKLKSSGARANALVFGMSGDDVENVQRLLKKLGYMSNVTGYFGSQTESAVKSFQKTNGLSVDGTVGKNTMAKLTSSDAKKAPSGSSGGGSSSGGGTSSDSANTTQADELISVAKTKLGCTYVFGSKGPNTFDCSGFVYWCLNKVGVNQSYMTSSAWAESTKYPKISDTDDLEKGDILVFKGHVGIYMGNGKMIDASSGKGEVVTRSGIWSSSYWNRNFICGFRVF